VNLSKLSFAYFCHKPLNSVLTIATLALGVAMVVFLLLVNIQLQHEFKRNLGGIDLVVGSKGSPIQLIMSTVFHLDTPTGSIPLAEADALRKDPLISRAIPLALGDNYKSYRIVGSTQDYLDLYKGRLVKGGRIWNKPMEVVLGFDVAVKTGLKLGGVFTGSHGVVSGGAAHDDHPYHVVGILQKNDSVLDRLIITALDSVWHVHGHHHEEHNKQTQTGHAEDNDEHHHDDHAEYHHHSQKEERAITAMLITYSSPIAALSLPQQINSMTSLQAASPAVQVARLNSFFGSGIEVFQIVAWFLIILAGFGIFSGLYSAMDERKYDMALIRSLGASPSILVRLVLCESLFLSVLGLTVGLVLGHGAVEVLGMTLAQSKHLVITGFTFSLMELWIVVATMVIGFFAGILPALRIYRLDVFKVLAKRP
jgi:putative ABC transport system permease protein